MNNWIQELDKMITQDTQVAEKISGSLEEAAEEEALQLEKEFDRQPESQPPAEPLLEEPPQSTVKPSKSAGLDKPIIGAISTEKMVHGNMILNGIAEHCVCCGMPLTDAVSIERGMGGICSKKGYAEDPKDADEMGAMIELAEFPELVEFLTKHYKPLGVRGLMNGLVRIAALNRKTRVHTVCANAIECLGYKNLANKVRDSLAIMAIKDSKRDGYLHVWVRRAEWTREWQQDCYKFVVGCFFDKAQKGLLVPKNEESKKALWRLMKKYYAGLCAKTPNGTVKIPAK